MPSFGAIGQILRATLTGRSGRKLFAGAAVAAIIGSSTLALGSALGGGPPAYAVASADAGARLLKAIDREEEAALSFKYVPFDVDESLSFDKQWEASAAKLGKNMEMVKKAKKTWDTKFERVRGRPEYPGWQGVGESAGSRQLAHNAVKPSSISAPGSISEPTNIDKTIHMGKQAANAPEGELVDYDKIFQSGDLQEDPKGPKWTYDDQYQESKFDPKPHDT